MPAGATAEEVEEEEEESMTGERSGGGISKGNAGDSAAKLAAQRVSGPLGRGNVAYVTRCVT